MARPVRGRMLLSVLIGLVRIAASLGFVWICKRLVDIATGDLDAPLPLHIGILLGVMFLQLLCAIGASAWESFNIVRTGNDLRYGTFAQVLRSTWTGKEAYHSGDAVNRLEEDVRVVTDLLCTRIPEVVITVVQLVAVSVTTSPVTHTADTAVNRQSPKPALPGRMLDTGSIRASVPNAISAKNPSTIT